jgi:hypothetical protein
MTTTINRARIGRITVIGFSYEFWSDEVICNGAVQAGQ